jgi:hypothetical protein
MIKPASSVAILLVAICFGAVCCKKDPSSSPPPLPPPPLHWGERIQDWSDHGTNPVFTTSANAWDSSVVLSPFVLKTGNGYRMWYTGSKDINDRVAVGYATSSDGIEWTKHSDNPVIEGRAGFFDEEGVFAPIVIQDGDTLRMWYGAGKNPDGAKMGYATSLDGISWNRFAAAVMQTSPIGEWYSDALIPGSVIKEGGMYKMWFSGGVGSMAGSTTGTKTGIGYATSADGRSWSVYNNETTTTAPYELSDPILNFGADGEWDANEMFTPSVLKTDLGYELWYSGWTPTTGQHIGYAYSDDGIKWTKHAQNPVFESKSWALGNVFPSVLWDGANNYRIWYQGWMTDHRAGVGYATMMK